MNATSYFGYRTIGIVHSSSHIVIGLHSTQNFGFWVGIFFSNFHFSFQILYPKVYLWQRATRKPKFRISHHNIVSNSRHQLRGPYSYHHSTIGSAPFWALLRQRAASSGCSNSSASRFFLRSKRRRGAKQFYPWGLIEWKCSVHIILSVVFLLLCSVLVSVKYVERPFNKFHEE